MDLILERIELEKLFYEKYPLHTLLPDVYLSEILFGIYVLISRDYAPVRERALAATRRLVQAPNLLRQAMKNLEQPPRMFVESGLHTCAGAIAFFTDSVPEFAQQVRGALQDALLESNDELINELQNFSEYLNGLLENKGKAHFAISKPVYIQVLKLAHGLKGDADSLVKIANKQIKQIEADLNTEIAKFSKKKDWIAVYSDLKKTHPTTSGLVGVYSREMKRARSFVVQNDLVTLPEGESIEVTPTPAFGRPLFPFAAYLPPAPLEEEQKGCFWVTVPDNMPAKEQGSLLGEHSKWGMAVTALHEAYPGHHLQTVHANRNKERLVRHLFPSALFAEGWAFYCEEMMFEQGFYTESKQRVMQLRDALWRAYRVVIDVGLHSKKLKPQQAIDMLVQKVGMEAAAAEAEVRRYCQTPTQPMTYLIGKLEIMDLLADYQKAKQKNKEEFSLKQFHDELLSFGTIPVAKIRMLMGL